MENTSIEETMKEFLLGQEEVFASGMCALPWN